MHKLPLQHWRRLLSLRAAAFKLCPVEVLAQADLSDEDEDDLAACCELGIA